MTRDQFLNEFSKLSPEDQEAVRAELIEGAQTDTAEGTGGLMAMMQQMMKKMMGGADPSEMMKKMMEH